METAGAIAQPSECPRSAWAVFDSLPYTKIWLATMLGLIGISMSDAASAWLMTGLNADPRAVSFVQVAAFLPMFMFTLPAGVLVDLVDARRFLLVLETVITVLVIGFAVLVSFKMATPRLLLILTFLLSGAWSTAAPAWAALTPLVLPRQDLEAGAAATSVGYNLSRVVGPALAGRLIVAIGVAAPFWGFALANAASVCTLLTWSPPPRPQAALPAERWWSALRVGLRHAFYNPHLRATIVRTIAVFPFAAAFVALLPLVARSQMTSGPQVYGLLLATASMGAALGSLGRPYVKRWLGPDRFVALGTSAIALGMVLLAVSRGAPFAFLAAFVSGAGWTSVLASLSVSAQVALPDWVRGRGLAIFLTAVFGSISLGSLVWGYTAARFGLPAAYLLAAAGAIASIPLSQAYRLQTAEGVDLTPSQHWPQQVLAHEVNDDSGPVLITLRYRLQGEDNGGFLDAIEEVGRQRRRDGAYGWGLFADVADKGVYLETFLLGSWLEARHLRARVTNADRVREESLRDLLVDAPTVTLMLHADAPKAGREKKQPGHSYYLTTSGTPA